MRQYNYIKAHRRRWHMTQSELGFLLGYGDSAHISRLENGERTPKISETILLELLFQKAANRLFPDLFSSLADKLLSRLSLFEQHLCEAPATRENLHKLDEIRKVRKELAQINQQRI